MALNDLLEQNGITPREVAEGSEIALSGVYEILSAKRNPTTKKVDAILGFLSRRLRRRVTYEEAFGRGSAA